VGAGEQAGLIGGRAEVGLPRSDGHPRYGGNSPKEDVYVEPTTKKRKPRREFKPEFKAEVVGLCRSGEKSIGQVARDLGLTESSVRHWVAQAEIDAGRREGLTTSEREELGRLRKEIRVVREERDILKRATVFFAKEIR
jgi:transposase